MTKRQLKTISMSFPEITKEWDFEKNGELNPNEISIWSPKKVWWFCEKGHSWHAYINNRTKRGDGCPYCSGRYATEETCLSNVNSELASEWHPTKNGTLTPRDITIYSGSKVWWQCPKNPKHEWDSVIGSRIRSVSISRGCPFCAGKKASEEYNLEVTNPTLASEWHSKRNAPLKPSDVTPSSNKQVWWICTVCDNEWLSSINNRNGKSHRRGCPNCNSGYQTSFPEQAIIYYFKEIFPDLINAYILPFSNKRITVDIFIPSLELAIEYDGEYSHRDKMERDTQKSNLLRENRIHFIRIREPNLPLIAEKEIKVLMRSDTYSYKSLEFVIKEMADYILRNFNISIKQVEKLEKIKSINIERHSSIIDSKVRMTKVERNLEKNHPLISQQWHPTKNENMRPCHYTKNSSKKVWWICDIGHEYQSKIVDKSENCLVCTNKIVHLTNCLATTHPDLANEWHPTKNEKLSPFDIVAGTTKRVWWNCNVCNHEWETSVAKRRGNKKLDGTGCPACSNKTTTKNNCLAISSPELVKEWHPTKNGKLSPFEVTSGSDKKVWWLCQTCQHEWDTNIYHRKKTGCPICGNSRTAKKLKKTNEEFVKEIQELVGDEYVPLEEYMGATTRIKFLHISCGMEYCTTPSKFKSQGNRCKCKKVVKT